MKDCYFLEPLQKDESSLAVVDLLLLDHFAALPELEGIVMDLLDSDNMG